ncbi:hypothetical protein H8356DRAFT_1332764 [Neocallimastix lanati (nom. inval.)]|nr:hypothetical protein H8356DRAFT_1332764 [Neocallimastix sp. JGI-2020a]
MKAEPLWFQTLLHFRKPRFRTTRNPNFCLLAVINFEILAIGSAFPRGSRRGVESVDAVLVWQLIIHPYNYMGKTKVFSL